MLVVNFKMIQLGIDQNWGRGVVWIGTRVKILRKVELTGEAKGLWTLTGKLWSYRNRKTQ